MILDMFLEKEIRAKAFLQILGRAFDGSIVIALSGFISLYFPFMPVPITIQNTVILFVAYLLGKKSGPLAVLMYIFYGVMGMPVFAGGRSGLLHLFGPTGGYIVGFFVASYLVANLHATSLLKKFYIFALGSAVIWLFGAIWLAGFIGLQKAIYLGVLPFIITDLLKAVVAAKLSNFRNKML